jgi:hypothetical protein
LGEPRLILAYALIVAMAAAGAALILRLRYTSRTATLARQARKSADRPRPASNKEDAA